MKVLRPTDLGHIGGRVFAAAVVLDMGKSLIEKQALIAFALAAMFATRAAKFDRLIIKGAKNIRHNKHLEKKDSTMLHRVGRHGKFTFRIWL